MDPVNVQSPVLYHPPQLTGSQCPCGRARRHAVTVPCGAGEIASPGGVFMDMAAPCETRLLCVFVPAGPFPPTLSRSPSPVGGGLVTCSYCDAGTRRCVAVSSRASGERTGARAVSFCSRDGGSRRMQVRALSGHDAGAGQEIAP